MHTPLLTIASAAHGAAADITFFSFQGLLAILTLTALEIVLGIDNVIVIALLSNKLPVHQRAKAQRAGIICAVGTRILLLLAISWLASLKNPINREWPELIPGYLHLGFLSGKDIVLAIGGAFLIWKSTKEIHHHMLAAGGMQEEPKAGKGASLFAGVIMQIMLVDIIFSLDSVITAVGMSNNLAIMITGVILSAAVMAFFAKPVAAFIEKNPTVKVLALAFLILVGVAILAEGLPYGGDEAGEPMHHGISKGVIYTAMLFSLGVEFLNIWAKKKGEKALHLKDSHLEEVQADEIPTPSTK